MEAIMQHFQHSMVYYFKKGKNTTETQNRICVMHGEGSVTDWMCQKCFAKFHADFSLDNVPQLGRPVEVASNQSQTLIENNQCYNMWEIEHCDSHASKGQKFRKCLKKILGPST